MKLINYLLFVSVFSVFGFSAVVYNVWKNSDADTQKSIETDILLFKHALIDQSAELKKLLHRYKEDAAGKKIINTFVKWGLDNQQEFLRIISSTTEPGESAPMTEKIAHVIFHGGSEYIAEFKQSYKDYDSKELKEIMSFVKMLEQEQKKLLTTTKPSP